MPIHYKHPKEVRLMRVAGALVAEAFELLRKHIQPGVSLYELDKLAEDFIRSRGAETLYKGYRGGDPKHPPFPGVICAAVNDVICHGIPNGRKLQEGDIVGIDIGLRLNGYCGDACVTYPVGNVSPEAQSLLEVAEKSLWVGIEATKPRGFLNDIGAAIQTYAESQGMSVVREWGGHGIGRSLHEPPSVGHVRVKGRGLRLRPGMVFTIEPMINDERRKTLRPIRAYGSHHRQWGRNFKSAKITSPHFVIKNAKISASCWVFIVSPKFCGITPAAYSSTT